MKKWIINLYFSFPVQLLVLHVRSNPLFIGLWIILILFISGNLGAKLGFQYLFLDPEYLGNVDFWSFFFLGIGLGGLIMSWNLTTYLLTAQFFPFLATLSRPFAKFSLNNLLIPIGILAFYVYKIIQFQYVSQLQEVSSVFMLCLGLLFGGFSVVMCYSVYFHFTNRDITYYEKKKSFPPNLIKSIVPGFRSVDLDIVKQDGSGLKVTTFLNESFQPRLVRSVAHYDNILIKKIFKQNHLNALVIQLLSMIVLVLIGYLISFPMFSIPAGASLLILMSLLIAIIGALTFWFKEWTFTVIVLLLVGLNYITSFNYFNQRNQAYGLNYNGEMAMYSYNALKDSCQLSQVQNDKDSTIAILEKWSKKNSPDSLQKPKMIILCVSGGGLKAALWTLKVLQETDKALNQNFFQQTVLITGASGGIIGAAYLREKLLQKLQGKKEINLYDPKLSDTLGQDLLNRVAFSMVSKDLLIPRSFFKYGDHYYRSDRGLIFEKQLNQNTGKILDKKLGDYRHPEKEGLVPMMFITPSIVNDARRLIISPQGVSYMMIAPAGVDDPDALEIDAVDFGLLFKNQKALDLRFLSALRMNATYPYVLPNVHLPTIPQIEVMDAGFLDNYGILSATRFIHVFKDWIKENTSGVVMVQISCSTRIETIRPSSQNGIFESLFNPLGIASKVFTIQEFEHDNSLGFIYDILGSTNFDIVRFIYSPASMESKETSISFHLTKQEKSDLLNAFEFEQNQKSLGKLKMILQ